MSPRLLVVDDEPDLRTLYELTLVREGYDVESAGTVEEGWARLVEAGRDGFRLVITDMRLPDGTGLDLLRRMDEAGRQREGHRHHRLRLARERGGGAQGRRLRLPHQAGGPAPVPRRGGLGAGPPARRPGGCAGPGARRRAAQRPRRAPPAPPRAALERMVGESAAMQQVRSLVERVALSMAPVLVHGESGTGKELVARAIHECSPRQAGPFVAVNCGAIPEALLEAEFFGYRKGAFTGANEDRGGFFQAAQGGTLFLDEIGDLPLQMQSKLLRVIQERAVRPIGAAIELPVNVRIVSATHKDLGAEVQAGRFRQDLYYRLNVIRIARAAAARAHRRHAGDLRRGARAHRGAMPASRRRRRWRPTRCSICCAIPSRAMCASSRTCCTAPWRWPPAP